MRNNIKISNFYEDNFISHFKEERNVLDQIYYSENNPSIDVIKIAEKLGFNIKFDFMNESGKIDGKTIHVNSLDAEVRQRFTIAHELGHYLLHSPGNTMFRDANIDRYEDIIDRIREREAK
ncbi:ImmA/IrrE family metallo-endopeptidase [Enterococcus casseliflavus]|uniref:ImmA/IrrE family metallo-endopeptidase n=1 Tax=Enterococcus casseliflavus TaxID=37734 RepID=A0A415EIS5_ENTCA|nr:ImmA/IrrE family metallo-endopeptidase [Enterococcus casseliflavus]